MYSLSIFFGPSPVPTQFLFKDKNKADIAYRSANANNHPEKSGFEIFDDFGQQAYFDYADFHGAILEDMDLGEESRIQRGLSQARGQANANKRALTDPVLQSAARGQGPSVLTPFGRNGFNG